MKIRGIAPHLWPEPVPRARHTSQPGLSATQTTLGRTPLYVRHSEAGAKLPAFHDWEQPLPYGSQIGEHHAAGMFDVSHRLAMDVTGPGARGSLRHACAGDIDRIPAGREDNAYADRHLYCAHVLNEASP